MPDSIHEAQAWSSSPQNGMVMGDYRDDFVVDNDDDEEEEEDRILDLLIRFVENIFRKVSRKARRAVKSVLPVPISTRLVGFAVNGTIILTFLWVLKAFLQESRSYRACDDDDDPLTWTRSQPQSHSL